jgi:hypothetical protein
METPSAFWARAGRIQTAHKVANGKLIPPSQRYHATSEKVGAIVYMVRETAEKGSEKQCANSVGIMLIKKS